MLQSKGVAFTSIKSINFLKFQSRKRFKMKIKSFEVMINKSNKAKELSDEQWQAKYDNNMESIFP